MLRPNGIIRLASPLQFDSPVDGPGLRTVIWTQGCFHNCPGCHNPQTHDPTEGEGCDINNICRTLDEYYQNITISGGEPFLQPEACSKIASHVRSTGRTVWVYTGYTYETLWQKAQTDKNIKAFLDNIDVLVDGRFMIEKKSLECPYRGSTNQRLIDVQKSLLKNQIVLFQTYTSNDSDRPKYF